MKNHHHLAANSIEGVFTCENPSSEEYIYKDEAFYNALKDCGEETIYGLVSDEMAEKINSEYGIQ